MTIMKHTTTCGRREMRALLKGREINVAPEDTRVRIVKGLAVRPSRLRRDHGTAPWNKQLAPASLSLPRRLRRALSGVRKLSGMESLVTMEKILRVKGGR